MRRRHNHLPEKLRRREPDIESLAYLFSPANHQFYDPALWNPQRKTVLVLSPCRLYLTGDGSLPTALLRKWHTVHPRSFGCIARKISGLARRRWWVQVGGGKIKELFHVRLRGISRIQAGKVEALFHELENRCVIHWRVRDIMRLGKWRNNDQRHTKTSTNKVVDGIFHGYEVTRLDAVRAGHVLNGRVSRIFACNNRLPC